MSSGLRSKGPVTNQVELPPTRRPKRGSKQISNPAMADDKEKDEYSSSELMKAIRSGTVLSEKISNQIGALDNKLAALTNRVEEVEQRVSDGEDVATKMQERLFILEKEIKTLRDHNTEMERRSRNYNLKIVNLKEGREGDDATSFFETFFFTIFGPSVPGRIDLQVAHRSPATLPKDSDPKPRTVWVRFVRLQDKAKILRLAQNRPRGNPLTFENAHIGIYPDHPTAIQRQRAKFNDAKDILKENDIRYGFLFPAKFQIDFQGERKIFESSTEVEEFLAQNNITAKDPVRAPRQLSD